MRRREFITLLGGAAAVWPLVARAQQSGKIYRIAILTAGSEITPASWKVFSEALRALGWIEGKNVVFPGIPRAERDVVRRKHRDFMGPPGRRGSTIISIGEPL